VDGNKAGSYLTMLSAGGAMFGVVNIIGNFGTVFVDQAYWQSAIAARPSAAVKGKKDERERERDWGAKRMSAT
jgi:Na+/proline symporter